MNKKLGIVKDIRYFDHVITRSSPENPDRIRNLYITLAQPLYSDELRYVTPREASDDEVLAVHSRFYIDQIRALALEGNSFAYDSDTYLMDKTLYTAGLAAGGCLKLADLVMNGEIDYGFALVRPPGHHAEPGRGMGFCVLNNAALTAAYLRRVYGLTRILIFDFDIHHGNGTQEIFYDDDEVLVVSLHQRNIFPFSGKAVEVGRDRGEGYNINIPVFSQFGDQEYTYLAGKVLGAIAEQYLPQIILVSAGYDGHAEDTISDTLLTTKWFGSVTSMLKKAAHEACDNRLLFILEGGYNPVVLEDSVLATINTLMRDDIPCVGIPFSKRADLILSGHPFRAFWSL